MNMRNLLASFVCWVVERWFCLARHSWKVIIKMDLKQMDG